MEGQFLFRAFITFVAERLCQRDFVRTHLQFLCRASVGAALPRRAAPSQLALEAYENQSPMGKGDRITSFQTIGFLIPNPSQVCPLIVWDVSLFPVRKGTFALGSREVNTGDKFLE